MGIDLRIPGDPDGIRRLATWLELLATDAETATMLALANINESQPLWIGLSGEAYRSASNRLVEVAAPTALFARDVAEVSRAYAARIERGRADFARWAQEAIGRGLIVVGLVVRLPATSLDRCPTADSPPADHAEWARYVQALADYDTLSRAIGTWWGEFEVWVAENYGPLAGRVEDFRPLAAFLAALRAGEEVLIDAVLDGAEARGQLDTQEWRRVANEMQDEYDLYREHRNSGNPALKAAAEAVDGRGVRDALRALNGALDTLDTVTRVIPVAGAVIDVVSAGAEIAQGGSATGVAAEIGGGLLGGWLVAGMAAGPVGWVAVAAISLATGNGGRWLWEAIVPLDQREEWDDAIRDFLLGEEIVFAPVPNPAPLPSPAPAG